MHVAVVPAERGPLERLLSLFAEVRRGEAGTALLMALNIFLLLTCYYIIKPVREALILSVPGGAEIKSYASAGQVILLLFFIPAYSAFANRVNRIRLIAWVTAFFIACLIGFYFLAQARLPMLGIIFFLWIGIFNMMIVAQFWSFANDIYTAEQGKRLFAIVAFGGTSGAILGAGIAKALIGPVGVNQLMLISAAILGASIVLTRIVETRARSDGMRGGPRVPEAPMSKAGGFQLVLSQRYLCLIGFLVLAINLVNTNGEYILGKTLSVLADRNIAAGLAGAAEARDYKKQFIGSFYAGYFTWVNLATALIQLFLVSRIIKWVGVRVALFLMPIVAFGGYAMLALAPVLGMVRVVKIAENSLDYSLQNTARQALFLPTSRDAKYKAKAAIDTFFVRSGDVLSALTVFVGTKLALGPQQFAGLNVALVLAWLAVLVGVAAEHRRLTESAEAPAGTPAVEPA